jgi:nitrite reductase/ring-hydroxylating ferredoxin subunit
LDKDISRKTFVHLGATLGVSVAGASVLSACGGAGDGSANDSNGGSGGGEAPAGQPIAASSEVESGSAKAFDDGGNPALLVHLENGDFVAYSATCTHQGCEVAYRDGNLACPCHGSVFDPANGGEVINGPARQPLPEIPVEVRDGEVYRA